MAQTMILILSEAKNVHKHYRASECSSTILLSIILDTFCITPCDAMRGILSMNFSAKDYKVFKAKFTVSVISELIIMSYAEPMIVSRISCYVLIFSSTMSSSASYSTHSYHLAILKVIRAIEFIKSSCL